MRKLSLIGLVTLFVSIPTFAGGLLTNTNQHIMFLRMLARDASTQIDAVYSNPAGLAFMEDGFHVSFNGQSAFQTRTITSTFAPFAGFGGNPTKVYKGEASAPFIPSFFGVYKKGNWAFSGNFAVTGGGGKATFDKGLGSFESIVAMLPNKLSAAGFATDKYSVNSYMEGKQYIFGLQLGATYKINENLSVFGGARVNYVTNHYYGYMKDISANVASLATPNVPGTEMVNVSKYFANVSSALLQQAATPGLDEAKVEELQRQAMIAAGVSRQAADIELDCEQTGWGVTPIIGADFKVGKWNFGLKYEFKTSLNVENKTKGDLPDDAAFDSYRDGVNPPNDIPALLTVGASYEILPVLRASLGFHYFFDKDAKMAGDKQQYLKSGTKEYLAGVEWDVCKWAQVSAGMQRTKYGFSDEFMSDMSFSVDSYSFGFGAGFNIAKNMKLNVAYMWTNYDTYNKEWSSYNGAVAVNPATGVKTPIPGTDSFTRTNKVFGIGLDYKF